MMFISKMSIKTPNAPSISDVLLKRLSEEDPNFQSSEYLHELQYLKTNLDRVNITYDQLQRHNLLPVLEKDEKSDITAKEQRELGNKLFTEGNYLEALESYTLSIANSKSKESLAMGYANRSVCLYKMKLYKECITDIDRALVKNYYPNHLRPKLLERRARAEKAFKVPERYYQDMPKIPSGRRNSTIQCARNCVEIRENSRFGRHVVATRDIQIGEVICVEKSYAHMIREGKLIHCHHCIELCYNPIPCPNCSLTVYCSEDCKNKARKSYHKYYCHLLLTFINCDMEPLHVLALKVVIFASEEYDRWENTEDQQYRSDRYKEIHNLMTAVRERPAKDLFTKTVVATCIYHLVKNNTNFLAETQMSEDTFKELLLHQMMAVCLNHLAIYENIQNENQNEGEMMGVGLYSFCSIFNHSCCPNVDSFQYGSTNVLRAVKTIPKGEQLFITYSLQYDGFSVNFRQEYLTNSFYFTCKCEACEHNWMLTDQTEISPTLSNDLKMSETEIYAMNLKLARGDVDVARKCLQHVIPQFKKCQDCEPYGNAWKMRDLISMCYRTLGNKRRI